MALEDYNRTTWEDAPSTETPLNADNLNNLEDGVARATAAIQELERTGVSPSAITAAVNAYLDEHGVRDSIWDMFDGTLQGDPSRIPSLFVEQNERGEYRLVYVDSSEEKEHEIFNFANLPAAKGEKGDKGDAYTLTDADKQEIANIAIAGLNGNGVAY